MKRSKISSLISSTFLIYQTDKLASAPHLSHVQFLIIESKLDTGSTLEYCVRHVPSYVTFDLFGWSLTPVREEEECHTYW